ncbi:MAG TPA: Grx4 family monothiol glutaredoxin [Methylococcaceae bacterium]|nr:Grx4 family monothiol glutaredoxin [Methylococcaceae bacterium]
MTIHARIETLLQTHPVLLFMKGTPDFPQCGFSGQAVQVLDACGAKFDHFNIFEDSELREALKSYSNWPTYPQLYINGELIGGCDIMIDLYKKGDLLNLLTAANAVAV